MRYEKTGLRDLTYSLWHRKLGDDITMIDVDSVEYCSKCLEPLAIIETARGLENLRKNAAVSARLAERLGIPAYIVLYEARGRRITRFRVLKIHPPDDGRWRLMSPLEMERMLTEIHAEHDRRYHLALEKSRAETPSPP